MIWPSLARLLAVLAAGYELGIGHLPGFALAVAAFLAMTLAMRGGELARFYRERLLATEGGVSSHLPLRSSLAPKSARPGDGIAPILCQSRLSFAVRSNWQR